MRRSVVPLAAALPLCLVWACAPRSDAPPTTSPAPPSTEQAAPAPPAEQETSEAPAESPEEPPEESSEEYKNNIRWSTASEVENAGFNVYRGDSADGPFERLNEDLIEGAYTTDEPQYYTFVDSNIDPYRAYFYYVESVSLAGVRENFTPVIAAKPKLPAN